MTTSVDFNKVEDHQLPIHDRLRNWARWVIVRPHSKVHPMFAHYRPAQHWDVKEHRETCDLIDAQALEKLISTLPMYHAYALRWHYVYRLPAAIARRALGTTYDGLNLYVRDARQMMINLTRGWG